MNPEDQEKERLQARIDAADAELQKELKRIFKKTPAGLNVDDKRFLQARRSYLTQAQQEEYADALNEKLPRPDGQTQEETLGEKSRADLELIATDLGIEEPKKIKNKEALVEAIEAKQKEAQDNA